MSRDITHGANVFRRQNDTSWVSREVEDDDGWFVVCDLAAEIMNDLYPIHRVIIDGSIYWRNRADGVDAWQVAGVPVEADVAEMLEALAVSRGQEA